MRQRLVKPHAAFGALTPHHRAEQAEFVEQQHGGLARGKQMRDALPRPAEAG